jgi:hypothetical protein
MCGLAVYTLQGLSSVANLDNDNKIENKKFKIVLFEEILK